MDCEHYIGGGNSDTCTAIAERMQNAEYLRSCSCRGDQKMCDFKKDECRRLMRELK